MWLPTQNSVGPSARTFLQSDKARVERRRRGAVEAQVAMQRLNRRTGCTDHGAQVEERRVASAQFLQGAADGRRRHGSSRARHGIAFERERDLLSLRAWHGCRQRDSPHVCG